jgi:HEAT repeat protein
MLKEVDQPTDNMIRNLFRVLDSDENDNVRLLALEALLKYSGSDEVREQLVASIAKQTSPLIQLRMVEIMTALTEKRAVPEFRRLLDEPGLNYSVRKSMQDALGTLL